MSEENTVLMTIYVIVRKKKAKQILTQMQLVNIWYLNANLNELPAV